VTTRGVKHHARWKHATSAEERAARRAAAVKRADQKQKAKRRRETRERRAAAAKAIRPQILRNCPQAFLISPHEALNAGLSIRKTLNLSKLFYMDHDGRLHREDHRSAAQLIAAYEKERKKKG
jgi:hypothetical protein